MNLSLAYDNSPVTEMNIAQMLDQEIEMWEKCNHPALLQRLVKLQGKVMQRAPALPDDVRQGKPKQCYQNATHLAYQGYGYMEGYVMGEGLPMLIHHAWNVDGDGLVIDNTLTYAREYQYFGMEFDIEELTSELDKNGFYGLMLSDIAYNFDLVYRHAPELQALVGQFQAGMVL